jgi:hypothetical protein
MKLLSLMGAIALTPSLLRGEELLAWPAHWMCAEAEAIMLGERVGANRVKVLEWLLPPTGGEGPNVEIKLMGLDLHSRVVRSGLHQAPVKGSGRKVLKSQRLVCFLNRKGDAWHSLSAVGEGSSGLVWIEGGRCYRYEQRLNPGPLELVAYRACATEKDLRAEIRLGLADRQEWAEAQTIVHPQEQAIVLAAYLLARTSPEGDHATYRQRVRQALPKLGRHAVEEILELLRSAQPDDRLGEAVLILHDLGPAARRAVPHLVTLLEKPEQVHPVRIIEALGRIGDASVAPQLLPFLKKGALQVRAEVATAMASFRYQDSAPMIVEALPGKFGQGDAYHVYAILLALTDLDPVRGREATRRYLNDPAMEHVKNLLEALLR